ncbi:hypothetical protein H312_01069 [Anncaliia algerae PRA339]|uniref:Protein PNS1 n=1 Tax=Anncaliia algerae PRA339 TaxID=1288291 RepID=A0A059F3F4_9MICR|nr:hypothetical protein H312_01069 [Anncaliia algerae PRA339]
MIVNTRRKLHDAWAFFLYLSVTIMVFGIIIVMRPQNPLQATDKSLLQINFLAALGTLVCAVLINLLMFRFAPTFFLHLGFIFSICFCFILPFFVQTVWSFITGFILGFISIYLYYSLFKYFKFTGKVLKGAAQIIDKYLLTLMPVLFIITSIIGAVFYILYPVIADLEDKKRLLNILLFFEFSWTTFNGLYFFIVFSASIVSIHLFNKGYKVGTFSSAIKNSAFCIGSICLGGLLLAVVNTLRYIVESGQERRQRNNEERNIFFEILIAILAFILRILEDIIHYANEWLFVYMAIHGKNYMDSLKESFRMATDTKNMLLINNIIVDQMLSMISFFYLLVYLTISYLISAEKIKASLNNLYPMVLAIVFPLFFLLFFLSCFLSLVSAAVKTIMFVFAEEKQCVKEVLPEVYEGFYEITQKNYGED